jgi:GcrA cell cycle regulator
VTFQTGNQGPWADETRVELLRKLWADGLSCSQIAKQLGGVSRSAVIGKVHRLGLAGRPTASKPARTVFKSPPPVKPSAQLEVRHQARAFGETRVPPVVPAPPPPPPPSPRFVDEAPGTATVLTLGASMCRWPIGDPQLESFTFCGRRAAGCSYCTEHAQIAYQPPQAKKQRGAAEIARSLRRYV